MKVEHVFVLMLENHSFDNMFAMSGIPDIIRATKLQFQRLEQDHLQRAHRCARQHAHRPGA